MKCAIVKPIQLGGKAVYPLVDGGKGIGFTDGVSAGLWAKMGGIGTFSAAAANYYDQQGKVVLYSFKSHIRAQRHEELIAQEIKGAIAQVEKAYEMAEGNGLINLNILWEMGGTQRILEGVLEKSAHLLNAVTAGAGIPYELGAIAAKYNIGFIPIVSSQRVTKILWMRAFKDYAKHLQAVVYEDPWKAGGHNGLSNQEDPLVPQSPKPRVKAIREFLNSVGLEHVPIIMAGNVWHLNEWRDFIDDPDMQPIAFQFGTRTLVTQENPSQHSMKMKYLSAGDEQRTVHLHDFSPTGLHSSALENTFLRKLIDRSNRQVEYKREKDEQFCCEFKLGARGRSIFVKINERDNVQTWIDQGFTAGLPTPDGTMVFCVEEEARQILEDQKACKGCLKGCKFSGWYEVDVNNHSTGITPDPRSFCIFNTLYAASHEDNADNNLLFAGQTVNRFSSDIFYKRDGAYYIPTIKELFERILTGY